MTSAQPHGDHAPHRHPAQRAPGAHAADLGHSRWAPITQQRMLGGRASRASGTCLWPVLVGACQVVRVLLNAGRLDRDRPLVARCLQEKGVSSPRPCFGRSGAEHPSAAVLTADKKPHVLTGPAGPHLRGFSSHAAVTCLSPAASTPPGQNPLTWHYALILDWPGRPRTVSTTCATWGRGPLASTTYHPSRSGPGADRINLALGISTPCRRSGARSDVYHQQTKNLLVSYSPKRLGFF